MADVPHAQAATSAPMGRLGPFHVQSDDCVNPGPKRQGRTNARPGHGAAQALADSFTMGFRSARLVATVHHKQQAQTMCCRRCLTLQGL